jgi:hypothetical protein
MESEGHFSAADNKELQILIAQQNGGLSPAALVSMDARAEPRA